MNDCDVINFFVAYLRENGHPGLQVDRWPDKENRGTADIDAVAGYFAIEHTSVDTVPNQRRDSNWFKQVVDGFENELPSTLPFRLRITLRHEAVTKGQDWAAIRKALKSWIIHESKHLPEGHNVVEGISGIPFCLTVTKMSNRPPGVFFGRFTPDDNTLSDRIRVQFDRKAEKLALYTDKVRILLVESSDIALMNDSIMLEAIQAAYPSGLPFGINQIWYADTSIPTSSEIEFMDFTADI